MFIWSTSPDSYRGRCSRMCSRMKMQTLHWLCQCGFVFPVPLQKLAFDGSRKNKTPLSCESGVFALSDHDWSRTSTS